MNPLTSAVLLLFAVGVTFAPWRRAVPPEPGRSLVLEGFLLAAAVTAGVLVADLARPTSSGRWWGQAMLIAAAYWYAVVGGVGVVRLVLALVPVGERGDKGVNAITVPAGELMRGRLIGVLERAVVLTLILIAQYGALGLIVAMKALARYKGLEDRDFAEYFLIGTLASLLHALLVGVGVRLLM